MNPFRYSDENIDEREFMLAFPSVMIGVTILAMPSDIAEATSYSDGWISILLAGVIFMVFAILAVKLSNTFPDQSFYAYASFLVTRPIAIIISFIFIISGIVIVGYIIRSLAFISQQYLFDRTPIEVLGLSFLLVVIYAVSGSRAGLFRLNVMFLPIILFVFLFVGLFNIQHLESSNFLPLFQTELKDYVKGTVNSFEAYIGFAIGLFYLCFIRKKKRLTKKVIIGTSIPIIFYLFIFLFSIGIFGNTVTENLMFPTVELAKRIDIHGAIFERIDAFIFTIWIMAIFTTTAIMLDISVLLLSSMFKKAKKRMITFILSPIVFYISMFPQQIDEVQKLASITSQIYVYFTFLVIIGLIIVAKIRGGNTS